MKSEFFCRAGHKRTKMNTYLKPGSKHRICRVCRAKDQRLRYARRKAEREGAPA